jgi:hypothetical protein
MGVQATNAITRLPAMGAKTYEDPRPFLADS